MKMNKGKLIVIEGTEYSGKDTQTRLLVERLRKSGIQIERSSFPMYNSPTGIIINSNINLFYQIINLIISTPNFN